MRKNLTMMCLDRCWWRIIINSRIMNLRDFINHSILIGNKILRIWRGDYLLPVVGAVGLLILLYGLDLWTQKNGRCGSGPMSRTWMFFCSRYADICIQLSDSCKVYGYYIGKGIYCIVLARFLNLAYFVKRKRF